MEWIRKLPTLIKGAIGMVTLVITFIVLLLNNIYLGVTVTVAVTLFAVFFFGLYLAFSKQKSEVYEGYTYRFPQHRRWALGSVVIVPILIIVLISNRSSRSFAIIAVVGIPTPLVTLTPIPPSTELPTPEPSLAASATFPSVAECREPKIHSSSEDFDKQMAEIPGGKFLMGDENIEPPKHEVEIKSFLIDKFEVTNLQYKQFVDDMNYRPPKGWSGTNFPLGKAFHPVTNVTWHDAVAYCEWVGKRLPTEAEWELACRGKENNLYPWGDEYELRLVNSNESACAETLSVGSYSPEGDTSFQISDMLGNVNEWTSSISMDYPYQFNDGREDPMEENDYRAIRGGSFHLEPLSCVHRLDALPSILAEDIGFRCAKDLTQP